MINGDLSRPHGRAPLTAAAGSSNGEVALLGFKSEGQEARGVTALVKRLNQQGVPFDEILVLMRGDFNESFSRPIKRELDAERTPYSDPNAVDRMLGEKENRQMTAMFHLRAERTDSLAWATLLLLTSGVGKEL